MLPLNKLYHMDCMDGMRQFPNGYFDLAIVDPVYGGVTQGGYMSEKTRGKRLGKGKIKQLEYHCGLWNQGKTQNDYFAELFRVSKNQIIWGGNYFTDSLPPSQCWIVWDKKRAEGINFAECELAFTSFDVHAKMFRYKWDGFLQENMKEKEARIHPTQKPVALYKWLLTNYAKEGDKILDTHVGSASSLIACHDLHFDFIGFELDETYYKAAKERMEQHFAQYTLF